MSANLGISTLATESQADPLLIGMLQPVEISPIIVATATGRTLKRGTMMGKITASGKYAEYNTDKSDGTQTFVGILGCDADASSADCKAFLLIHAEFNKSAIACFAGATTVALTTTPTGIFNNTVIIKEML